MLTSKKVWLVIIALGLSLIVFWFERKNDEFPDESSVVTSNSRNSAKPEADEVDVAMATDLQKQVQQSRPIARKNPVQARPSAFVSGTDPAIEILLSNPGLAYRDEAFELSTEQLDALYALLGNMDYEGSWRPIARLIGINGESDTSTKHLLDFIQDYPDPQDTHPRLRQRMMWSRLEAIQYLGLTKGVQVEKFLVKAFQNPGELNAVKQIHALHQEGHADGWILYEIDVIARNYVIRALFFLGNEEYTEMMITDYRKLAAEREKIMAKPDAPGPYRYTLYDSERLALHGALKDELIRYDILNEYGLDAYLRMSPEYIYELTWEEFARTKW